MSGLILQPCRLSSSGRKENFLASVARLRTVADVEGLLPPAELEALRTAVGENSFALWGAKRGRQSTFDRISPGMRVLFIGDRKAYADLTVLHRFSSPLPQLARAVWPSQGEDGEPWEAVMALSAPRPIDLDYAVVKNLMNFEDNFVQRKLFVYTEPTEDRPIDILIDRIGKEPAAGLPLWESIGVSANNSNGRPNNPNWAWEEEILAFELLRQAGKLLGSHDPRVQALSAELQALSIHPARVRGSTFRNPNGVSRKIADLQTNRPGYSGKSTSSSRIDRLAWQHLGPLSDFELASLAATIRRGGRIREPDEGRDESRRDDIIRWFRERDGQEVLWSELHQAENGDFRATAAAAIHKPEFSDFVVSISIRLGSPYGPEGKVLLDDGGWLIRYRPESQSGNEAVPRNAALMQTMDAKQPVAVLRQITKNPSSYLIDGVGQVLRFDGRHFIISSHSSTERLEQALRETFGPDYQIALDVAAEVAKDAQSKGQPPARKTGQRKPAAPSVSPPGIDPTDVQDGRRRVQQEVAVRRGQAQFRRQLLDAYNERCAITNCDATQALEAAHILPYRNDDHNEVQNGLLLRADIHTLLDRGDLAIEPDSRTVHLVEELRASTYGELHGRAVAEPIDPAYRPHESYLRAAWSRLGAQQNFNSVKPQ